MRLRENNVGNVDTNQLGAMYNSAIKHRPKTRTYSW